MVAAALLAACASCGNDAADPPMALRTPEVAAADPPPRTDSTATATAAEAASVANGRSDDLDPEPKNLREMDVHEMDLAELDLAELGLIEENPLGGCAGCHVDVEDELKGSIHLAEEVGCVECHGPSDEHVRDENNEAKPDEVFARKDIDRLCGDCHGCSRPRTAKAAAATAADPKVCTDCHHAHNLTIVE